MGELYRVPTMVSSKESDEVEEAGARKGEG